jgi:hypothetical protein
MNNDFWMRLLELERRGMRFDSSILQLEQEQAETSTKTRIVSSNAKVRLNSQIAITDWPWIDQIKIRLVKVVTVNNVTYDTPVTTSVDGVGNIYYPPSPGGTTIYPLPTLSHQQLLFNWTTATKSFHGPVTIGTIPYIKSTYSYFNQISPDLWHSVDVQFLYNLTNGQVTVLNADNRIQSPTSCFDMQFPFVSGAGVIDSPGPTEDSSSVINQTVEARATGANFSGVCYSYVFAGVGTMEISWGM